VVGVVGHVEADPGQREAQRDGQQSGLPPGVGHEHEPRPRRGRPGEDDGALEVDARLGAPRPAGFIDQFTHALLQFRVEGAAAVELDAPRAPHVDRGQRTTPRAHPVTTAQRPPDTVIIFTTPSSTPDLSDAVGVLEAPRRPKAVTTPRAR